MTGGQNNGFGHITVNFPKHITAETQSDLYTV